MLVPKLLSAVGAVVLVGALAVPAASAETVSIGATPTAMSGTTTFSVYGAGAVCPSGSTLVGGGAALTRNGVAVGNDGSVLLGVAPSSGGTPAGNGATDPTTWTATGGYAGQAPGTDTLTSYVLCATADITGATEVEVAATTNSLGPVTATCPTGTSLVGGGGGYTAFPGGTTNTKLLASYPSSAGGVVAANGAADPTSWTVVGSSTTATGADTAVYAVCATDLSVATEVETATTAQTTVGGGTSVTATAACPAGTVLLDGGVEVTTTPSGPGTAGQGVHLSGDYPSTSAGAAATGSAAAWTATAVNGGQSLTALTDESLVLCDTASPTVAAPEVGRPAVLLVIAAAGAAGLVLYRRRRLSPR